jgi:hypothetical protein
MNYKSCGVDLIPAEINSNSYCLLCGGCLKTCKTFKTKNNSSRPNPGFVKTGFANDLMQMRSVLPAEQFFLFLLTASTIFEITHFQVISDMSSSLFPKNISVVLGFSEGIWKNLAEVVYLYLLLPLILWILPFLLLRSFRTGISSRTYMKDISLVFIPVIAAFFIGLSIMEIVTKFPYYKFIIYDIRGVETTKALLFKQIEMPQLPNWIHLSFIFILILSLAIGFVISSKVTRKQLINLEIKETQGLPYVLPLIFIIVLVTESFMFFNF